MSADELKMCNGEIPVPPNTGPEEEIVVPPAGIHDEEAGLAETEPNRPWWSRGPEADQDIARMVEEALEEWEDDEMQKLEQDISKAGTPPGIHCLRHSIKAGLRNSRRKSEPTRPPHANGSGIAVTPVAAKAGLRKSKRKSTPANTDHSYNTAVVRTSEKSREKKSTRNSFGKSAKPAETSNQRGAAPISTRKAGLRRSRTHSITQTVSGIMMDDPGEEFPYLSGTAVASQTNVGQESQTMTPGAYRMPATEADFPGLPPAAFAADNPEPSEPAVHINVFDPGTNGLVEAREVLGDSSPELICADPSQTAEERTAKRKRQELMGILIGFTVILLSLGTLFGLIFGYSPVSSELGPEELSSLPQAEFPTVAPVGPLDQLFKSVSNQTLKSLTTPLSPQWNAYEWLFSHPELPNMPEWRKQQLFALASFFFAMEGPSWRDVIRERWLDYGTPECLWYSTLYGWIGSDGQYEEANGNFKDDPCNDKREFQKLYLSDLDIPQHSPFIPPEIAMLTSLSEIDVEGNLINASFGDFVPSELFKMTQLEHLNLHENLLSGTIPTELGLLTGLEFLELGRNPVSGTIPTELAMLTRVKHVALAVSSLSGTIPSQLGRWHNVKELFLLLNSLTGCLPSEIGLLTSAKLLWARTNRLRGPIPSQIGLMTAISSLYLKENRLSGHIPSETGLMTKLEDLRLDINALTGTIPSQLGSVTKMSLLRLGDNLLSGTIPSELARLENLHQLVLNNNSLTGSLPTELDTLAADGSLGLLLLHDNLLQGTISSKTCALGGHDSNISNPVLAGVSFDCGHQLCGCCWCSCETNTNGKGCSIFTPALDAPGWPGLFPTPVGDNHILTINIYTDNHAEETTLEWSKFDVSSHQYELLETMSPTRNNSLFSYTMNIEARQNYRLSLFDEAGDGFCCASGFGWFSVINSTPSKAHANGTIMIHGSGAAIKRKMEAFFLADAEGRPEYFAKLERPGDSDD